MRDDLYGKFNKYQKNKNIWGFLMNLPLILVLISLALFYNSLFFKDLLFGVMSGSGLFFSILGINSLLDFYDHRLEFEGKKLFIRDAKRMFIPMLLGMGLTIYSNIHYFSWPSLLISLLFVIIISLAVVGIYEVLDYYYPNQ